MAAERHAPEATFDPREAEPVTAARRTAYSAVGRPRDAEPPDRAVAALAARQHGVVRRDQLLSAGLTRHAIAHRVRTGRLHRLHPGVFAVGHTALTPTGRALAAVLACGRGAALSHRSAAVAWALLDDRPGPVDVTVLTQRRRRAGMTLHRTSALSPSDVVRRDGVAVTTPVRTLLDLAAAGASELERALTEARVRRLVADHELRVRSHGRPGARALGLLLAEGPAFTRSEAERRLLGLLARAQLPRPRTNVRVGAHEVDAYWPAQRLVVEVDGYAFHSSRAAFERDRLRDAALQATGHRVLRTTWRQLTDHPEAVVARIAAMLAAG
jgi:very-short-patch-repair endonuclease